MIDDQPAHDFPYDLVGEQVFYGHGFWRGSGFRHYHGTPVFRSVNGNTNRDFWVFCGYWFISDRMKAVLERVDPAAFEFRKCKVLLPDGTDGPVRWMCDILRVLGAVDEEKSAVKIEANSLGKKMYGTPLPRPLVFKDDAVGSHHIFRVRYAKEVVICDEEMRLACKAAGLKGTYFDDVGRPPPTIPKEVLEELEASYRGRPTFLRELRRDHFLELGDDLMTAGPAIAARCALRAIPLLERLTWGKPQRKRVRSGKRISISMSAIAQGRFRGVATAWVAARFPAFGKGERLREMAYQAEWAGTDSTTREAMLAAELVLRYDHGLTEESQLREYMTSHCISTAYHAAHDFMELYDPEATKRFYGPRDSQADWEPCGPELAISNAVLEDIGRLKQGESVQSLLEQPLWLTPAPQYVLDDWKNLMARLLGRSDEHWNVWIDWYAARLAGGASLLEKDEVARVSLPDEVWNQGVAIANARIAELAG